MIDVHCHLNFHAFKKDYDEVIKRAQGDGVEKVISRKRQHRQKSARIN